MNDPRLIGPARGESLVLLAATKKQMGEVPRILAAKAQLFAWPGGYGC